MHPKKRSTEPASMLMFVPWEQLCLMFHSDAGFGNAAASKTQAGYFVAFTDRWLEQDQQAPWLVSNLLEVISHA